MTGGVSSTLREMSRALGRRPRGHLTRRIICIATQVSDPATLTDGVGGNGRTSCGLIATTALDRHRTHLRTVVDAPGGVGADTLRVGPLRFEAIYWSSNQDLQQHGGASTPILRRPADAEITLKGRLFRRAGHPYDTATRPIDLACPEPTGTRPPEMTRHTSMPHPKNATCGRRTRPPATCCRARSGERKGRPRREGQGTSFGRVQRVSRRPAGRTTPFR